MELEVVLDLLQRGKMSSASAMAEEISRNATSPSAFYFGLAEQALAKGFIAAALEWASHAVALDPAVSENLTRLGKLQFGLARWQEAAQSFRMAARLDTNDPRPLLGQAQALLAAGHYDRASRVEAMLQKQFAHLPETHVLQAEIARMHGDRSAAMRSLESALHRDPSCAAALRLVAELDPGSAGLQWLSTIEAQLALGQCEESAAALEFALARIREAQGNTAAAFGHYCRSSEAQRGLLEQRGVTCQVDRLLQWQKDAERLFLFGMQKPPRFEVAPLVRPIFIIGMPRTGTTLVETILSRHGLVAAGGELDAANRVYARFIRARVAAGRDGAVDPTDSQDRELLLDARESYVERALEHSGDAPFVTDKHPGNAPLVGFLRLIFPDAPVIACRRNSLATCWSIFTSFLPAASVCFRTFDGLSLYHKSYSALMEHWRATARPAMIDVEYEALVTNPLTEIPALVSSCGLAWDSRCLHPDEGRQPVNTASVDQIRRPIHRGSIERYRQFDAHLGALREGLQR